VENERLLCDAPVADDALDLAAPLPGRRVEPRVLWQDEWFWLPDDGARLDLSALGPADAAWLLGVLTGMAPRLHAVAAADEDLTLPTAARRALRALGVPLVAQTDPHAWLESTVLVRSLRRRAG
jgi:hypothetical protein